MSAQYVLGVDLGTTFTAAAVAVGDEPPVAVPLGSRAATMPTVAYLGPDGEFLVGEAAERRALTDPDRVVRRFKRRIGDETPLLIGDGAGATRQHAHSLAARVISWVVSQVTLRQGEAPQRIVVTHPVGWGPHKQELLIRSLADLGLDNVSLLSEPQAAAVAFASTGRLPAGAVLAVYDLGGGTFDASVLQVGAHAAFRPVGRAVGLPDLGGIDFDDAILAHVIDSLGADDVCLDPDDPMVATALSRLRQECVGAKEALSVDTAATVPVLLGGLHTSVRVTRAEFETMISPAIAATVEALDAALDSLAEDTEISHVLLTGGSSRIPLVTQALSAHLGSAVRLDRDLDPTMAVALGAALAARPRPEPVAPPVPALDDDLDDEPTLTNLPALIPAPARPEAEVRELARPVPAAEPSRGGRLVVGALVLGVVAAATVGGAMYGLNLVHHQDDPPVAATVQLQEDHPQATPSVGGPNAVGAPTPTPGTTQNSTPVNRSAVPSVSRPVYNRPAVISAPVSRGSRTVSDQAAPRRPQSRPAIRPQQQPQRPVSAPAGPAAPAAAPADNTSTGATEFHEAPAAPAKPKPATPHFTGFGPTAPPTP